MPKLILGQNATILDLDTLSAVSHFEDLTISKSMWQLINEKLAKSESIFCGGDDVVVIIDYGTPILPRSRKQSIPFCCSVSVLATSMLQWTTYHVSSATLTGILRFDVLNLTKIIRKQSGISELIRQKVATTTWRLK
jgi:hypothetical protein